MTSEEELNTPLKATEKFPDLRAVVGVHLGFHKDDLAQFAFLDSFQKADDLRVIAINITSME